MYKSSRFLYIMFKYYFLLMCSLVVFQLAYILIRHGLDSDFSIAALVLALLATLFYLGHNHFKNKVVRVEISNSHIKVLNKDRVIDWKDVEEIKFNFLGLYRLRLKDSETVYFPPYDIVIHILGAKFFDDKMDEIIDSKRVQLGFR